MTATIEHAAAKVPEVTLVFWLIKIAATTLGDLMDHDAAGPRRAAEFMGGGPDDEVQAEVAGFVRALVGRCG